jgi:hypothetical protein
MLGETSQKVFLANTAILASMNALKNPAEKLIQSMSITLLRPVRLKYHA